jgi:ubiquinone/menaquinone biosynthesis C-methylase UbiE
MSERPLDPDCLRYARHWAPVLAAPALRALGRTDEVPSVFLDLGAGTGTIASAAAERWPSTRLLALDASEAMLAVARTRAGDHESGRFVWLPADAAAIPLDDAAVDVVASSFLLQLVADRPAVLSEVLRVLRPGGTFSFVTWLADELVLPADVVYHEVLGDIDGDDDQEEDEGLRSPRSGDYHSLQQAQAELIEAGYEAVMVMADELVYRWTAESYLAFKLEYEDHERIDSLDEARRARLHAELVGSLAELPPAAFEVHGSLVAAVARRPPG